MLISARSKGKEYPFRSKRTCHGRYPQRHGPEQNAHSLWRHVPRIFGLHAPAIRLAALMETHVVYVFTHDSIGLGEDGPTHQPIGHLSSLRAMPHVFVIRPADANETSIAWKVALTDPKRPMRSSCRVRTFRYLTDQSTPGGQRGKRRLCLLDCKGTLTSYCFLPEQRSYHSCAAEELNKSG